MRPDRSTRYRRALDLDSWRGDDRIASRGFVHHWDSVVADGNGEDFFLDLLDEYLGPNSDVLDVGCGHGEFTLELARRARSVIGIEREPDYLALAGELRVESGLTNVTFVEAELAGAGEDRIGVPLPLPDDSVDVVVNRRGPVLLRYFDDLRRVVRPGTVVIGIHPAGTAPTPPWSRDLPSLNDRFPSLPFAEVASWVTRPLAEHAIDDYRLWWIDVPEYIASAKSLYDRLATLDTPPWTQVCSEVEVAFDKHQIDGAIVLRHLRLVWVARLP